jgi:hypothetical protein
MTPNLPLDDWRENRPTYLIETRGFQRLRLTMEMTMRKLTILVVLLIAALTAQAATAAERHHARTKDRDVISERIRNGNAYDRYIAPGYSAGPSRLQELDNGEMASGPAGH